MFRSDAKTDAGPELRPRSSTNVHPSSIAPPSRSSHTAIRVLCKDGCLLQRCRPQGWLSCGTCSRNWPRIPRLRPCPNLVLVMDWFGLTLVFSSLASSPWPLSVLSSVALGSLSVAVTRSSRHPRSTHRRKTRNSSSSTFSHLFLVSAMTSSLFDVFHDCWRPGTNGVTREFLKNVEAEEKKAKQ